MGTLEQQIIEVDNLWQTAIKSGNKTEMQLYCDKSSELKKQVYPVELTIESERNYLGNNTGRKYLLVNFSKPCNGWIDKTIFHMVKNGKIVPNELGTKLNVKMSAGGGSAFLDFPTNVINEVKLILESNGYKTIVT